MDKTVFFFLVPTIQVFGCVLNCCYTHTVCLIQFFFKYAFLHFPYIYLFCRVKLFVHKQRLNVSIRRDNNKSYFAFDGNKCKIQQSGSFHKHQCSLKIDTFILLIFSVDPFQRTFSKKKKRLSGFQQINNKLWIN